jgi:hypothetical protein
MLQLTNRAIATQEQVRKRLQGAGALGGTLSLLEHSITHVNAVLIYVLFMPANNYNNLSTFANRIDRLIENMLLFSSNPRAQNTRIK